MGTDVDMRNVTNDLAWRARAAWRGATVAVVLTIVGMPMELAVDVPGVPSWAPISSLVLAFALLVTLLTRRERPSLRLAHASFLLNVLGVLVALWFVNIAFAESGRRWVPFQSNKLGMLAVALLAPELWVGIVCIGSYVSAALVQMAALGPEVRSRFALGEPWATIAIGAFSMILLAHHLKRLALEREVARAHAEVLTAQKFTKVLLAVRDLSNTPLQTIMFAAATARAKHPDLEPIMALVDRALRTLQHLDERLREQEAALEWTTNEESFDPMKVIQVQHERAS